jgi:hypothetical protein
MGIIHPPFKSFYSAVSDFTRAYNVASAHERGVDALNALKKEFENTNAVKEQAEDLRAEFDNKTIGRNESATMWISILENYRLCL